MSVLKRIVATLTRDLDSLHARDVEQSAAVAEALRRARAERVKLALAVQSRRWTSTS